MPSNVNPRNKDRVTPGHSGCGFMYKAAEQKYVYFSYVCLSNIAVAFCQKLRANCRKIRFNLSEVSKDATRWDHLSFAIVGLVFFALPFASPVAKSLTVIFFQST